MSTPPNKERPPNKSLKEKLRSVFSSSRNPRRNLEVQSTSTNQTDGPRIKAERTESGKKIGFNSYIQGFEHILPEELSDVKQSLFTDSSAPANDTTSTSETITSMTLTLWLSMKDINSRP